MTERRQANYKLLKAMEAFEPAHPESRLGTCGNIQEVINGSYRSISSGKWGYRGGALKGKAFHEAVSAPFLLAKLVASYQGIQVLTHGQEAYKVTWTVVLKHKASGAIVTFYDWKGSASIGSNIDPGKIEPEFKKDLVALVKSLANPRFPHPYDGCSIGEVA